MEGLTIIEADDPNTDGVAARKILGPSEPEPPRRKLRDRKVAGGGVRAAEPACADEQHADAGSGPINQG